MGVAGGKKRRWYTPDASQYVLDDGIQHHDDDVIEDRKGDTQLTYAQRLNYVLANAPPPSSSKGSKHNQPQKVRMGGMNHTTWVM